MPEKRRIKVIGAFCVGYCKLVMIVSGMAKKCSITRQIFKISTVSSTITDFGRNYSNLLLHLFVSSPNSLNVDKFVTRYYFNF